MSPSDRWVEPPPPQPGYQPPPQPGQHAAMTCPKCRGTMHTYERNRIHLEQCDTCRGIFLDVGELEALTRLESQLAQQQYAPPPPGQHYGPGWGTYGTKHYRKQGFGRLFFSS